MVLREFDLQQWQVQLGGFDAADAGLLRADDIALNVKGISTDLSQPVELALGLKLNDAGVISVRGTAQAEPPKASVEVGVEGLDLRPLPALREFVCHLTINSGTVNVRGKADYQTAETNRANAAFQGEVSVINLLTADQSQHEDSSSGPGWTWRASMSPGTRTMSRWRPSVSTG